MSHKNSKIKMSHNVFKRLNSISKNSKPLVYYSDKAIERR